MRYFRNQRITPPPMVRGIATRSTERVAGVIPFGDVTEDPKEEGVGLSPGPDRLIEAVSVIDVVPVARNRRGERVELLDHGRDLTGLRDDDHDLYYPLDGIRALRADVPIGAAARSFTYEGVEAVQISANSSATQYLVLTSRSAGFSARLTCDGNLTDQDLDIRAKGAGEIVITNLKMEGSVDFGAAGTAEVKSIKLDDFATPDDNTDLDFSTTVHGLVPKGTNTGNFLKDDGTWAAVAGGGNVVGSAAVIADNAVVHGDGGARGVQDSPVIISDAGAMSGISKLTVDNLEFDGVSITSLSGQGHIILAPTAVTGAVTVFFRGGSADTRDAVRIQNTAWELNMTDTRSVIAFQHAYTFEGDIDYSARISVGTETNWTSTASTRDAYMSFHMAENGSVGEQMRITSDGRMCLRTADPMQFRSSYIFFVLHNEGNHANLAVAVESNTATHRGTNLFMRARGTEATKLAVASGDWLGAFLCGGYDGSTYQYSAFFKFIVDGAVSSGTVPAAMVFETGAPSRVERFRIQSDGLLVCSAPLQVVSKTNANRGAAGTAGRVVFNTDDGQLNIDDGANWTLPDGTAT